MQSVSSGGASCRGDEIALGCLAAELAGHPADAALMTWRVILKMQRLMIWHVARQMQSRGSFRLAAWLPNWRVILQAHMQLSRSIGSG